MEREHDDEEHQAADEPGGRSREPEPPDRGHHRLASNGAAGSAAPGLGDDLPEGCEILIKVLRRDPLPLPGPTPVGVAEVGLLVMVPSAEAGEVVELRDLGPSEGVAVVEFEVPPDVAARKMHLGSRTSSALRR